VISATIEPRLRDRFFGDRTFLLDLKRVLDILSVGFLVPTHVDACPPVGGVKILALLHRLRILKRLAAREPLPQVFTLSFVPVPLSLLPDLSLLLLDRGPDPPNALFFNPDLAAFAVLDFLVVKVPAFFPPR